MLLNNTINGQLWFVAQFLFLLLADFGLCWDICFLFLLKLLLSVSRMLLDSSTKVYSPNFSRRFQVSNPLMKPHIIKSDTNSFPFLYSFTAVTMQRLSPMHRSQHYGTVFLEKKELTMGGNCSDTGGQGFKRVSLSQVQGKI